MLSKAKKNFTFILKISTVLIAFYFIYVKLSANWQQNWAILKILVFKTSAFGIFFILFLSFLNRFLEILKWQNLVQTFQRISVLESTKQVLSALTLAIFTPNGLGEYAGKAIFYSKTETKKVIFLNLICNGIQLLISVFFGILGLICLGYYFYSLILLAFFLVSLIIVLLVKNFKVLNYSMHDLTMKIKEIPSKTHFKNIILGVCRYATFSHQYFFLFLFFGVKLPYFTLMATIACVYFLASSLPNFQFLDFAVKGSVALYFFSKFEVNSLIVLFIATLMWFLNTVLPVVLGSYFVLKYKSE